MRYPRRINHAPSWRSSFFHSSFGPVLTCLHCSLLKKASCCYTLTFSLMWTSLDFWLVTKYLHKFWLDLVRLRMSTIYNIVLSLLLFSSSFKMTFLLWAAPLLQSRVGMMACVSCHTNFFHWLEITYNQVRFINPYSWSAIWPNWQIKLHHSTTATAVVISISQQPYHCQQTQAGHCPQWDVSASRGQSWLDYATVLFQVDSPI